MDISHVEEGNGSNRNGGVSPRWSGARGVHERVERQSTEIVFDRLDSYLSLRGRLWVGVKSSAWDSEVSMGSGGKAVSLVV